VAPPAAGDAKHGSVWVQPLAGLSDYLHDPILARDRGHEYVDKGLHYYDERHRLRQIHSLKKRAAKLGLQIIEPQTA